MAYPPPPKPEPILGAEHARVTTPPTSRARVKEPDDADETDLETTLLATERARTSLSGMMEALNTFAAGMAGTQMSGEHLARQLSNLERLLRRTCSERQTLERRVNTLTRELEVARQDSELEHKYVRDEQDRFIAALIDEYEVELQRLRDAAGATADTEFSRPTTAEVQELKAELAKSRAEVESVVQERETLRALVHRVQEQRDEAQKERKRLREALAEMRDSWPGAVNNDDRHTRPTEPPAGPNAERAARARALGLNPESAATIPALALRDLQGWDGEGWDNVASPAPPPGFDTPSFDSSMPRTTEPPGELTGALTLPSKPAHELVAQAGLHIPASEQVTLPPQQQARQTISPPAAGERAPARDVASIEPNASAQPNAHGFPAMQGPSVQTQDRPSVPPEVTTNVRPRSMYPELYPFDEKPPLKRKPDHSLRPLVGYSKQSGEVQAERLSAPPARKNGHQQR